MRVLPASPSHLPALGRPEAALQLTPQRTVEKLAEKALHLRARRGALAFDAIDQPVDPRVLRQWRGASVRMQRLQQDISIPDLTQRASNLLRGPVQRLVPLPGKCRLGNIHRRSQPARRNANVVDPLDIRALRGRRESPPKRRASARRCSARIVSRNLPSAALC